MNILTLISSYINEEANLYTCSGGCWQFTPIARAVANVTIIIIIIITMAITITITIIMMMIIIIIIIIISNSNWTEWSTIQVVIRRVISNRARPI